MVALAVVLMAEFLTSSSSSLEAVALVFATNESNASGTVRKRQRTTTTVAIQSSRRSYLRDVDVDAVGVMAAVTGRWGWEWA